MRLLLVEDDAETRAYVRRGLLELGHQVDVAVDGQEGLLMASEGHYDVVILDRMLPRLDGMGVLSAMRAASVRTPVLVLTALGDVEARVEGIEAGADDYLAKPFSFAELAARLGALARRPPLTDHAPTRLTLADLDMDRLKREVRRAGRLIELQPREFRLLEYLLEHSNRVVTRAMLLEHVWDYHFDPRTSVVETHISRLRAKIDRDFDVELLHTVRGAGYCLKVPEA